MTNEEVNRIIHEAMGKASLENENKLYVLYATQRENARLEAENSVLREQNFAMNKRLSDIRKAVEEVE